MHEGTVPQISLYIFVSTETSFINLAEGKRYQKQNKQQKAPLLINQLF